LVITKKHGDLSDFAAYAALHLLKKEMMVLKVGNGDKGRW